MKKKEKLGDSFIWSVFLLYAAIGLVWTLYRAFFHFSEGWDEFLFKPLIFLGPVFLWVKLKEKQDLGSLGFSRSNFLKIFSLEFFLDFYLRPKER
jgi:hypothetical protein